MTTSEKVLHLRKAKRLLVDVLLDENDPWVAFIIMDALNEVERLLYIKEPLDDQLTLW